MGGEKYEELMWRGVISIIAIQYFMSCIYDNIECVWNGRDVSLTRVHASRELREKEEYIDGYTYRCIGGCTDV